MSNAVAIPTIAERLSERTRRERESARVEWPQLPQPQNLDAEQALLGAILVNNVAYHKVAGRLRAEHFAEAVHGRIFAAIERVVARGGIANPVTLKEQFDQDRALSEVGGSFYLAKLAAAVVTIINADDYAAEIRDCYRRRLLIEMGRDAIIAATYPRPEQDGAAIAEEIERRLWDVADEAGEGGMAPIGSSIDATLDMIGERFRDRKPAGLRTGLQALDDIIGGLAPKKVYVIGGRPSMGKTALAGSIARNVAGAHLDNPTLPGLDPEPPKVVAIFSLEMDKDEWNERLLARETGIEVQRQRRGVSHEEVQHLVDAGAFLKMLSLHVDETPAIGLAYLRGVCERMKRRGGLDLVVVDYLQLMEGDGGDRERRLALAKISRGLKRLAKVLEVPVLLLSQLTRDVERREDKRPNLSDLRECVTGDTRVQLADGSQLPVRDLVGTAPEVVSMTRAGRLCRARASAVTRMGVRRVYEIRLASGRTIRATWDHRLWGLHGWVHVSDLKLGSRLALSRSIPEPAKPDRWPEHQIVLLAHLIGDGSYLSNRPMRYTTGSAACSEAVREAALAFGAIVKRHEGRGNWHQLVISGNGTRWQPAGVGRWLRELGVWGQRSSGKRVPAAVFRLPNSQLALFLRHLWATDGTIAGRVGGRVGPATYFATASAGLAEDVATLLLRFGIVGRISKSENCYQVWIRGADSLRSFLDKVGAFGPRLPQAERLRERLAGRVANTNVDTLPIEVFDIVRATMKRRGISHRQMAAMRGTRYGGNAHFAFAPSRDVIADYARLLHSKRLASIASSDLFWDRVTAIEPAGEEEVFDLTVPRTSAWIANGIVSHNTGDIEQDSDVVMFVYREEYYLERAKPQPRVDETDEKFFARLSSWETRMSQVRGRCDILVDKHRGGRIGVATVGFDGVRQLFHNHVIGGVS